MKLFTDKDMEENCLIKSEEKEECFMCGHETYYIEYLSEGRLCSKSCRESFYKLVNKQELNDIETENARKWLVNELSKEEFRQLKRFKKYFDELYGEGLEVANWHLNGELEPFDRFYESALEYMEREEE